MKRITQKHNQTILDIVYQEYGSILGLEVILMNNPKLNLQSRNQEIDIFPKVFDDKSTKILNLYKYHETEVVSGDIGRSRISQFSSEFNFEFNFMGNSSNFFSQQFSNQF